MGKNQVTQLESEGLAGVDALPPGSAPLSFLQQELEHSYRLKLMPLVEWSKLSREAETNVCVRQHPDLGDM